MLRRLPIHPFLFASYPILFLVAGNLGGQASLASAAVPLAFALAATTVVWAGLWTLVRDVHKVAVIASALVLLFFSFGHVRTALFAGSGPSVELVLLGVWLVVAMVVIAGVARTGRPLLRATFVLNVLAGVLVLMNLVPIVAGAVGSRSEEGETGVSGSELSGLPAVAPTSKRDIYYLVFDRYANEEILQRRFDFDNGDFLESLEQRGFYVAHDSVANHPRTGHSLASSLNMTYLTYLEDEEGASSGDWDAIYELLRDAELTRYLRSIGYRYHHIGSWWSPTAKTPQADVNHVYGAPSEFSSVLLRSTIWPTLERVLGLEESYGRRATERRRVAFQIDALLSVEEDPAPTFTLAHFLIPHPPFVFDREGGPVTDEVVAERGARASYVEQLLYTNSVIEAIVDDLVDGGADDPIVVIQSDEGPHPPRLKRLERSFDWFDATDGELRQKLLILNAYYFPGDHDDQLYQAISPVNSFRVMLNEYMGAELELLPDRVYVYRDFHHPYEFREVTDRLSTARPKPRL